MGYAGDDGRHIARTMREPGLLDWYTPGERREEDAPMELDEELRACARRVTALLRPRRPTVLYYATNGLDDRPEGWEKQAAEELGQLQLGATS